ncbi:hypothetical protein OPAG_06914 [Rhodococcus opacus PD630]|uniref:putative quinol monooxygenase n=1 Tax=Rhodococcus opacus TaxID=37919 RepID=UPI00029CD520|nr:antibiotic biosynthesis monooxygenase [Rhodococcus opacus]AHK36129.1 hypothetical protein Pd630_LPD16170 [Rhodococcus opacus PD630]EHI43626.1 hypothetical protein OPAG_06914 [Rhodococcus opacus PD630]UDH01249.1 hypothetical protein K2Z90_007713 [Rhodococcus opacus PD630]
MYALTVKFVALPGKRDAIVATLDPDMIKQVHKEDETLLYSINLDADDENVIWFWMLFSDEEAFHRHSSSEVDQRAVEIFQPLLQSYELHPMKAVGGKGIPLP